LTPKTGQKLVRLLKSKKRRGAGTEVTGKRKGGAKGAAVGLSK